MYFPGSIEDIIHWKPVNPSTWIPIICAVFAPIGTYIVTVRKTSGKIGTSDANELWEESRSIREDYRGQLDRANKRIRELELRIERLESVNNALVTENFKLKRTIVELQDELEEMRAG